MAEQYGFFVDSSRCVKCWACEVACQQWHEIKAATVHRREVREDVEGTFPNVKREPCLCGDLPSGRSLQA